MADAGAMAVDPTAQGWISKALHFEGKMCSILEDMGRLLEQSQAEVQHIRPDLVGIHPSNRDGGGVRWAHVHELGANVVKLGFMWDECNTAVRVEDDEQGSVAAFTQQFLAAAAPQLVAAGANVQYGSLACSHLNQFLRCAAAEVPSQEAALGDGHRVSLVKICNGDSNIKLAIELGLKWYVVKARAVKLYPELSGLIQQARNAPGHVQSGFAGPTDDAIA